MINVKELQKEAQKELQKEATDQAKAHLKGLYQTRAKAELTLKNIDRQIEAYLQEVNELATYGAAGVDVSKK